jgi:hypothetical protein
MISPPYGLTWSNLLLKTRMPDERLKRAEFLQLNVPNTEIVLLTGAHPIRTAG